jgi:hypothetical protein
LIVVVERTNEPQTLRFSSSMDIAVVVVVIITVSPASALIC